MLAPGDGALWIPLPADGAVARFDPTTGVRLGSISVGAADRTNRIWIGVGQDGAVWASSARDHRLVRIDPATNTVSDTIALDIAPAAFAIDDDALWIVAPDDNRVLRIDLPTGKVSASLDITRPEHVVIGAGAVWVAHAGNTVARIDPATNQVFAIIPLGMTPQRSPVDSAPGTLRLAYGSGSIWVAVESLDTVVRIDPDANRVIGDRGPARPHRNCCRRQ